jgi:hypothetical protein
MGTGHGGSQPHSETVSVGAVEALIASFPGVVNVRIVLDESGALGEIHVLADASRPAKAIVRDIESGLAARWGMAVDHRRISVAQMVDAPRSHRVGRLRLQQWGMTIDPATGWIEVAVSLTPAGEPLRAECAQRPAPGTTAIWQGRAAGSGQLGLRIAAEAAVEALNQSVTADQRFALIDVVRVALGQREAVVCLLHHRTPRDGISLTGSALVRDEAVEAAVRAVLNGSNRLYERAASQRLEQEAREGPPALSAGSVEAAATTDPADNDAVD